MKRVIDSRQLLAFSAVAHRGSFTWAAKDLFLTQSAISHAIKALETDIGCRLVDRVGKRVMLTQAGEQFQRHAERILGEMDSARSGLDSLVNWGHGRLRVGASVTACQYILPTVLREFKQSFPKCVIRIEPGDHGLQMDLLRNGQIDLALMPIDEDHAKEFEVAWLFDDELRFLVDPMHPWAQAGGVARDRIGEETFVLYNKNSYTFRLITNYFRDEKITLTNTIELGSMEAIKELVKIGLGVGILAPWIVDKEIKHGSLVAFPLGRRKLKRRWGIAYLKGRRLPLAEETFVGLSKEAVQTLFPSD